MPAIAADVFDVKEVIRVVIAVHFNPEYISLEFWFNFDICEDISQKW